MTASHLPYQHPLRRAQRARQLMAENGLRWTIYAALLGGFRKAGHAVYERMVRLELQHQLSGRNTVALNYQRWQDWDWSNLGEEWSASEEWKQSLIDEVMLKYLRPETTILEIGPGAGRWTETLQRIAGHLTVVDLSDRCIELCRQRFAGASNMEFHVNDGKTLSAVAASSIDGVWSFDVFVHIAPREIGSYIAEIGRVLRPGGIAVIHHAAVGRENDAAALGWRSTMTASLFAEMVQDQGLSLITQFDSWGRDGRFDVRLHQDVVTVFRKAPQAASASAPHVGVESDGAK
ncbi:MAG: class I SAM-dependent methyltransferase [Candidatus Dormibacteraeota bacterium]|nr:class I SAM-dependent methyltransferase [Candidatus Dormibacteraeota bacterium]